jgi:hypothetical protein
MEWDGFGVAEGAAAEWRIGWEYQEPGGPWSLRIGLGQEQQSDVPEARAGVIGLGFGWNPEGTGIDIGILHRTIKRADQPTSYDDRIVASVGIAF